MKDKKNRKYSIRKTVPNVLILIFCTIVALNVIASVYMLYMTYNNTMISNRNTLEYFSEQNNQNLQDMTTLLAGKVMQSNDWFKLINNDEHELTQFDMVSNVIEYYKNTPLLDDFSMLFVYGPNRDIKREIYNKDEALPFIERRALTSVLETRLERDRDFAKKMWTSVKAGNHYYLVRIFEDKGYFAGAAVSYERLKFYLSDAAEAKGYLFTCCDDEGNVFFNIDTISKYEIDVTGESENYYLSGCWNNRYMVLKQSIKNSQSFLLLLIPINSIHENLPFVLLTILIASIIVIIAIPCIIVLMKRCFVKPFDLLLETINELEKSEAIKELPGYVFEEFESVQTALIRMANSIGELTVRTMEEKNLKEKAQLNYYRAQLRPHFFLNCLKNLYALAQQDKRLEMQEMIMDLSAYFRYMFRDISQAVTLEEEIRHMESYLRIFNNTGIFKIELRYKIAPELHLMKIPPMLLQTFLENMIKHGQTNTPLLVMDIQVNQLKTDSQTFIDITITNSGKAFEEMVLETLNKHGEELYKEGHIGIWNVRQQLGLYFGNEAQIVFYNSAAEKPTIKIIVPIIILENGETL